MSDKKYTEDDIQRLGGIIAEKFEDQLTKLVESIDARISHHIQPVREDIHELKQDMHVVKAAVIDTSHEVRELDKRVSQLEAHLPA